MLNKVMLIGNLGKDPEVKNLQGGSQVATFSMAVSERWRDKNTGEQKEKTEWANIVIWNEHLIKIAEQYLKKGSKCFVEGSLQTRKWQDQSGTDRYTTEIVLQKFKGSIELLDSKGAASDPARGNAYAEAKDSGGGTRHADLDDDIPY